LTAFGAVDLGNGLFIQNIFAEENLRGLLTAKASLSVTLTHCCPPG
jgi:hypothetical protein